MLSVLLLSCLLGAVHSSTTANDRFDCYPEPGASQQACEARGCEWDGDQCDQSGISNCPYCFYPSNWFYSSTSVIDTTYGMSARLDQVKFRSPYGGDIVNVAWKAYYDTSERLRVRMTDADAPNGRYEVPIDLPRIPSTQATNLKYTVQATTDSQTGDFHWSVYRSGGSKSLVVAFDQPGSIYSDQYLQTTMRFASTVKLYGYGERYSSFIIPMDSFTTLSAFATDIGDGQSWHNSYGTHPFVLGVDSNDGSAFGLFIVNSNAQELEITPMPGAQYRTIGGILDMFIIVADSATDVISQYWQIHQAPPPLPALWHLGFHLCRWGYETVNRTREIVEGMRANGVPYDTQWNDIDYMDGLKDFTYDPTNFAGLPDFVSDELHDKYHMKYIQILDPTISNSSNYPPYQNGLQSDAFLKNAFGKVTIGKQWPGYVAFPDFWSDNGKEFWTHQFVNWHQTVAIDGAWIDMNEVSNFVTGSTDGCPMSSALESPPYYPSGLVYDSLQSKTLCMTDVHRLGNGSVTHTEYDVHSLNGYSEMIATQDALNAIHNSTLRNFVLSRSTFAGSGKYGAHWTGDNNAQFTDLYLSISGMIMFNFFGIPMVGADICGFNGDTNDELCTRWMSLGSFYPFMRNHNTVGATPQDPVSLGDPVLSISIKYLKLRYSLLPFWYRCFYEAHMKYLPIIRPLFFHSTAAAMDIDALSTDKQYWIGDSILVCPVLTQGDVSVDCLFPVADSERYFDLIDGYELDLPDTDAAVTSLTIDAPLDYVPAFVLGGSILSMQPLGDSGALTTDEQAVLPYSILIAVDSSGFAAGGLVADDGYSADTIDEDAFSMIMFELEQSGDNTYQLFNKIDHEGYTDWKNGGILDSFTIYGLSSSVSQITMNGQTSNIDFDFDSTNMVLTVKNLQIKVLSDISIQITTE